MPILAAENALILVEELQAFLGKDSTAAVNTDERNFQINQASQRIIDFLQRLVSPMADIAEVFDGDGTKEYYAKNIVINGTGTTLECWNGSTWDDIDPDLTPWTIDTNTGRVYFNQGGIFWDGSDNYRLNYNTGYTQANVPAPIKSACCQLVQRAMLRAGKGKEGLGSEAVGEASTSYNLKTDQQILDDIPVTYRHMSVGA